MPAVRNPYWKWIRTTWIVAGVSLLSLLVGFALRAASVPAWRYFFFVVPLLLFAIILLPILFFTGRVERRQIEQMLDGNYLARWTYQEDEWKRFTETEWDRARRKATSLPFQVLGIGVVAGIVLAMFSGSVSFAQGLLVGGGLGIPLGILAGVLFHLSGRSAYRSRLIGPREVYIGPAGVYQHESYTSWQSAATSLHDVKLETGDPSLLRFEIKGHRGAVQELRVAVPKGSDREALDLVTRFKARAPAALMPSADDQIKAWLNDLTARLQPDKITFQQGETLGGVFQRIITEEERKVQSTEQNPKLKALKLLALDELRKQFA